MLSSKSLHPTRSWMKPVIRQRINDNVHDIVENLIYPECSENAEERGIVGDLDDVRGRSA